MDRPRIHGLVDTLLSAERGVGDEAAAKAVLAAGRQLRSFVDACEQIATWNLAQLAADGRSAPVTDAPAGPAPPDRRVAGHPEAPRRPQNRRPGRSSSRLRRLRRGLAGAVAGLAAGVLATSAVPVAVSGAGTAQPRTVQERTVVPNTSTALFRSLDEAMVPREFSGAATGLR